jgi:DNA-binding response OmpR family regulator
MTVQPVAFTPQRWLRAVPTAGPVAILVLAEGTSLDRDDLEQLAADLSRTLRENRPPIDSTTHAAVGSVAVRLDHEARRLVVGSREVALTHLEFELLAYLVRNRARAVTRPELLERVWNYEAIASDRTVDVHVRRLRRKLADVLQLTTVRGYGYRFDGWRDPPAA